MKPDVCGVSLFGVALVPSAEMVQRVVEFRARASFRGWVTGPMLGVDMNVPHVSILQCPFDVSVLSEDVLLELWGLVEVSGASLRGKFLGVYEQPAGWCFMGVDCSEWGLRLQSVSLDVLGGSVRREDVSWDGSEAVWSESERLNQERWGYRYVGDDFIPHITLGRFDGVSGAVPSAGLIECFEAELAGVEFGFSRLVFYRAGEFGVLESVLAEVGL